MGMEGYDLSNVFGELDFFRVGELGCGCGEEVGVVGEDEDGGYGVSVGMVAVGIGLIGIDC